jgi:hypothetical protein
VSPTNKTERHDIIEILLKVALSTIKQTNRCSTRFVMHVYMVVKLLLLTMPTLYEIIVWWIFLFKKKKLKKKKTGTSDNSKKE